MAEWLGETQCRYYRGIKLSKEKKCCGGKTFMRHRVDCALNRIAYAHIDCKRDNCPRFKT